MQAVLPDDIKVSFEFDQSRPSPARSWTVVTEGLLGAVLTGLMVLLFLRDWRSVIVVVLNIPFALCGALVALWLDGQTINLMTLGGLALAIGILVDESTVEVENIHTQIRPGASRAGGSRSQQPTVLPRLLAMLCVLAVFIPSFFMQEPAALFVPLSLAVGFAMVTSYLLSSTFVPVFSTWIMKESHKGEEKEGSFGKLRTRYERYLNTVLDRRWSIIIGYFGLTALILILVAPRIGNEIFPDSNGPVLRMRLRHPSEQESKRRSLW